HARLLSLAARGWLRELVPALLHAAAGFVLLALLLALSALVLRAASSRARAAARALVVAAVGFAVATGRDAGAWTGADAWRAHPRRARRAPDSRGGLAGNVVALLRAGALALVVARAAARQDEPAPRRAWRRAAAGVALALGALLLAHPAWTMLARRSPPPLAG